MCGILDLGGQPLVNATGHECVELMDRVLPCERMGSEARVVLDLVFDHASVLQPDADLGRHLLGIFLGVFVKRERALKIVLVVVGLLFSALVYPLMMFVRQEPALARMLSVYVTLGVFLLLAARNPSANRSLIAFTAWSSFAHAALMAVQAFRNFIARGELLGVAVLVIIGVGLIALAPGKQSVGRESAVPILTS